MGRTHFEDLLTFTAGFWYDRPELAEPGAYMANGSMNAVFTAPGKWKPFGGLTLDAGKVGSPLTFNVNGGYAGLGNKASLGTAKGSIASYMRDALLMVGSGEVYLNGARLQAGTGPTNVSASTTPRMVLKQSGAYTGSADNGPFEMGLDVPRMPTTATIASGNTSRMSVASTPSNYSIQVCAGRSLTGHISNPTAVSTPLSVTNMQAMAVTFGAAGSNGEDRWHVYGSKEDEGGTGQCLKLPREIKESELSASETKTASHTNGSATVTLTVGTVDRDDIGKRIRIADFDGIGGTFTSWIRDVPVAPGATTATTLTMADNITATGSGKTATIDSQVGGVARTLAFEWYDSDLLPETPPVDHNRPPKCVFLAPLGDRILYIACYADGTSDPTAANPGTMVQVSKIGFPEACPADFDHLFALPGAPTAVIPRESDGAVFVFGADYLCLFRNGAVNTETGRDVEMVVLLNNVGVYSQRAVVLADGWLYCYTGAAGLARINSSGEVDRSFAAPVADYFSATAIENVHLGFDPAMMQVFVYGPTTAVPFSLPAGVWGAPCGGSGVSSWPNGGLSGISHFFTASRALYACLDTGAADYPVYRFNYGPGSTWQIVSGWRDGGHPGRVKTITSVKPVVSAANFGEAAQTVTVAAYRNLLSTFAASKTFTYSAETAPQLGAWKSNIKNCRSYKFTLTGGGIYGAFNEVIVGGTAQSITV